MKGENKMKIPKIIKKDYLYTMEYEAFWRGYQKGYRAGVKRGYKRGALDLIQHQLKKEMFANQ